MDVIFLCFIFTLLQGITESTKCYVCGELSLLADSCVDDYLVKEKDLVDCSAVLGHTDGCIKSKYVDKDSSQIVSRSCAPELGMKASNECKSTQVAGIHVFFCHCTGDYCNASAKLTANGILAILAVVVSIFS